MHATHSLFFAAESHESDDVAQAHQQARSATQTARTSHEDNEHVNTTLCAVSV
eukprot:m.97030 g.97030  ORF g.97030 m.97030 type:complete len:53 (-) comp13091_c0_seq2:3017-3175(-)